MIFKTTPSGGEATYHAIVWSCTAGPGLSPEESDPRAEEVGELHNGPQEETDIRRHRAVGFRPEQPYLRTFTLLDEDRGTPSAAHMRTHWPKHLLRGGATTTHDHQPHCQSS